jgi:hypothetical protein
VKPTGTIIFFGRGLFSHHVISILEKEYQYTLIWKKGNKITGHLNASKQPLSNHEDILIFQKGSKTKDGKSTVIASTYNPVMSEGCTRYASVLNVSKPKTDNCYGEQKITQTEDSNARFPTSVLDF